MIKRKRLLNISEKKKKTFTQKKSVMHKCLLKEKHMRNWLKKDKRTALKFWQ